MIELKLDNVRSRNFLLDSTVQALGQEREVRALTLFQSALTVTLFSIGPSPSEPLLT